MSEPLVTIAIPLHNSAAFIGETVASALGQTHQNIEVLVLDDGSTDGSARIVASIDDPRLRLIRHESNIGMAHNYNRAIENFRGDYLMWLSHDDVLLPGHVAHCLDYYRDHPDVDIYYGELIMIDADGRWYDSHQWMSMDGARSFKGRNEAANLLTRDCFVPIQSVLIPRAVINEFGGVDPDLESAIDWEYWIRLATGGKRFGYEARHAALFRVHEGNASGDGKYRASGKALRDTLRIYLKHLTPENHRYVAGYAEELREFLGRRLRQLHENAGDEGAERIKLQSSQLFQRTLAVIDSLPAVSSEILAATGLISVVVPHSGRVERLQRALKSLRNQTYQNWEAVVVCDGTMDPTAAIDALGLGERVRVVERIATGGPAAARNTGLRNVNGEVVMYLDDDDEFGAEYLDAVRRAFVNPDIQVAVGRSQTAVGSGYGDVVASGQFRLVAVSPDADAVPLGAVAHRRSVLSRIGYFREDLPVLEGWEFLLRLTELPTVMLDIDAYTVIVDSGQPLHPRLISHHLYGRRQEEGWQAFFAVLNAIYGAFPATTQAQISRRSNYAAAATRAVAERLTQGAETPASVLNFAEALRGAQ